MNFGKAFFEKAKSMVESEWNRELNETLEVSVMGQAGVGKSSLINALFDTHLNTDPVRAGTTEIVHHLEVSPSGHKVMFYDLPGIGESISRDKQYIEQYQEKLSSSNVAIWAIMADSRSFVYDCDALKKVLSIVPSKDQQIELMSKIIFVLTKVDLLTPPEPSPWILSKMGEFGVFKPQKQIRDLIEQKERYFQEALIRDFGEMIRGQTYCNGTFKKNNLHKIQQDGKKVFYQGFLDMKERDVLKAAFPKHKDLFDRLYDSYRIIPCSSHFKFNLNLLIRVIVDRLKSRSAAPFSGFLKTDIMSTLPLSQAKQYRNVILLDEEHGYKLDIADANF